MKFTPVPFIALLVFLFSCTEKNSAPDPRLNQSGEFKQLLDAHGDWSKWIEAEAFSFAMVHETTLEWENHYFNLKKRQARIDADLWQIGNDGEKVWISPNRENFKGQSVRFYQNLYYSFFTLPYALTDTTVTVTPIADQLVNGVSYKALEAIQGPGSNTGPTNRYILLQNTESGRLEWVIFAVNYNNTTAPPNILKYEDYRDAGGLVFPRVITGYDFQNDSTGRIRYQVSFSDVFLVNEALDDKLFEMPEAAVLGN